MSGGASGLAVYTVGHSTRPLEDFLELLRTHGVQLVADVRTVPRSRRNPQYDRDTLAAALAGAGIGYAHLAGLGGWRKSRPDSRHTGWRSAGFRGYADYMETDAFEAGLAELLGLARGPSSRRPETHRGGVRVAVMCAEAVPERCHRRLLADALLARGVEVRHILSGAPARPHVLTSWVRVEGTRLWYPGA